MEPATHSPTAEPPAPGVDPGGGAAPAPTLELTNLRKTFGDHVAVDDVSMAVPGGQIFGLLGPNGAGKTTTIRMIMDIYAPDAGRIHLFGRPRQRQDSEIIGYLPEERGLYQKMKVLDLLVFLGQIRGLKRKIARERATEWLERMELDERMDSKVEELSKGMQQKIQLAGTVIHDPKVVILDEPFSGLDPINQELFKNTLARFKQEGRTILFSTHVMEQAEKLCDHICLISKGRAILQGRLADIQREQGGNAWRVRATGPLERCAEVPGVDDVVAGEGEAKLFLADGVEGSAVLRELVGFLEVTEFRSQEPDLEEIFIKAVRHAD